MNEWHIIFCNPCCLLLKTEDSRIKYLSVFGSFINVSDRFTAMARVNNFALNALSLIAFLLLSMYFIYVMYIFKLPILIVRVTLECPIVRNTVYVQNNMSGRYIEAT